ncbi:unnamed protein product [Rotaria socialis]|uniref:Uncharacterized protein n=1 Tax=Rotaria socialis TaxID=392032 RepID=A0A820RXH9_9BILA|nr:unnamed protein product [Rotaria socialis]CAF4442940.1 unnamed protein product [Rotaria socialis]
MTTFHLATINVHHFRHSVTYNINIEELVGIHKPYDLAFVVAQEINSFDNWSKFCNLLGLENIVFGASESDSFGNGIGSRYSFKSFSNQPTSFSCFDVVRALLQCRLDDDHSFCKDRTFAVTHLDYRNEDDRQNK